MPARPAIAPGARPERLAGLGRFPEREVGRVLLALIHLTPSRMEENFALFDFELDGSDVEAISALDKGENGRTGPHPDTFAYVPG